MTAKTVTGADVDALFNGTLTRPASAKRLTLATKPVQARYDRCSGCSELTALLLTFSGETDWSPELPETGPIRNYIRDLRRVGRRTILLCTTCVSENMQYRSAISSSDHEVARLFEL